MTTKNEAGQEMLLDQSLKQIDRWAKQEEFREELLIQSVKHFGENLKQRQVNTKEVAEQFSKQIQEWEKASREQFLTTMAPLHQLFPTHSFEQINEQLDYVQRTTANIALTPLHQLLKEDFVDGYMSTVEKYVEYRKNSREKYVENVKEASSMIYRNQSALFQMVKSQMKNVFFPLNRFMKQPNEKAQS